MQQRELLFQLKALFMKATESGLFDKLQPELANPDSINDVCDTVEAALDETTYYNFPRTVGDLKDRLVGLPDEMPFELVVVSSESLPIGKRLDVRKVCGQKELALTVDF